MQVAENGAPHKVGVQRRDAIHPARAHEGKVAHLHALAVVFLDQRDRSQEVGVGAALRASRVEMACVDFANDLHMPRQQAFEQRDGPCLERLGQQRVVGVIEDRRRDRPREAPRHAVQVDQQAHEFRHGNRRMRVVELDGGMIPQRRKLPVLLLVPADEILQRRRGEEVFLAQPQVQARRRVVIRVENARDRLEPDAIGQRSDMVAPVEVVERDWIGCAGRPQAQRVHLPSAPAGDRRVECHRGDGLLRMPDVAQRAIPLSNFLHAAAEIHRVHDAGLLEFPRVPERQPLFRQLMLPSVLQDLPEYPVVVAYAVAERRDFQRRHAFHEAGRETTQPAVTQRSVGLEPAQFVEIDTEHVEGFAHRRREAEIGHRVVQQAADQEFEREIVDALSALAIRRARRVEPAVDDAVADRQRGGHEPVMIERAAAILAHHVRELGDDGVSHVLRRTGRGRRWRAFSVCVVSVGCHAIAVRR